MKAPTSTLFDQTTVAESGIIFVVEEVGRDVRVVFFLGIYTAASRRCQNLVFTEVISSNLNQSSVCENIMVEAFNFERQTRPQYAHANNIPLQRGREREKGRIAS